MWLILLWLPSQARFLFYSLTSPQTPALTPVTTQLISKCAPQGPDLSPSLNTFCPGIFSASTSSELPCQLMAPEGLSATPWLSWFQFHRPNPLLKIYSRLSPWCLRLNKPCLKSTSHIFPKCPALLVFIVKLPFPFSLSSKPQSLLAAFPFPSSLKLFPSSSPVKHFFKPSLPSALSSLVMPSSP